MRTIEDLLRVELTNPENFLVIKETLTRIGVASRKEKKLFQSCHILHKRGYYYIVSFKEMFVLDGKHSDVTEDDIARRNTIAALLEEWGLIRIHDQTRAASPRAPISQIKVVSFKEKGEYTLIPKYTIGQRR
jgi:hypothetical protein